MINYRELRLGNYIMVTHAGTEVIGIISGLNLNAPIEEEHRCMVTVSFLQSMPDLSTGIICPNSKLTPTLLDASLFRKIGFGKGDCWNISTEDFFELHTDTLHITADKGCSNSANREWGIHIDNKDFDTVGRGDVRYLHQLQNLVFDCTGEEIPITL